MSRAGHRGGGWFGFGGDGDDEPRARSVLKFQWSPPPPPSHGACGQRHTWGSDRRCDPSGLGSTQGGRRGLAGADAQPLALSQPGFDSRPDETSRASSLRGFGQQRPAGQHSRNLAPSRGSLSTQAGAVTSSRGLCGRLSTWMSRRYRVVREASRAPSHAGCVDHAEGLAWLVLPMSWLCTAVARERTSGRAAGSDPNP